MAFNTTLKHFTSSQELAPLWATAQNYLLNQLVLQNDIIYRCAIAHTSGTFATDLGAGKWVAVSTTSSSGTKNYISNPNFENNTATGWSLFNTTIDATTKIPSGSVTAGAAGFSALAVTSSSPLAGTYSLSVATPAGVTITTTAQGFISSAFTIDNEDKAKVMGFSFYYQAVSGTIDFSGTSTNTFAVYIRDVSGGAWIQPAGVYNLTQSSGSGLCSGTFQTTATGTQYQIAVMMINTVSAGVSLLFDDFQLGPQKVVYGSPVTDWQLYTPSVIDGSTNRDSEFSSRLGLYRRVGDSIELQIYLARSASASAGASGNAYVTLPSGIAIRTTAPDNPLGTYWVSSDQNFQGTIQPGAGYLWIIRNIGTLALTYNNTTFAPSTNHGIRATAPVQGWSSSVQMSNDTDTRVVAAVLEGTPTSTIAASFSSSGNINFPTNTVDTHAGWSSGIYTIPVSGNYSFIISTAISGTASNSYFDVSMYVDAVSFKTSQGSVYSGTLVHTRDITFSGRFNAGQQISFRPQTNIGTPSWNGNGRLIISRLSGPATIAASETVAMRYKSTTTNLSTSVATVIYSSKDYDSHGIYNTSNGIITIPISGTYNLSASYWSSANWSAGDNLSISVIVGSTEYILGRPITPTATAAIVTSAGATQFYATAGTQVYIRGSAQISISPFLDNRGNWITLNRLGN